MSVAAGLHTRVGFLSGSCRSDLGEEGARGEVHERVSSACECFRTAFNTQTVGMGRRREVCKGGRHGNGIGGWGHIDGGMEKGIIGRYEGRIGE